MQFPTTFLILAFAAASQVAAAPTPQGRACTPQNKCVNAGMLVTPGSPGNKFVIDNAISKIKGLFGKKGK